MAGLSHHQIFLSASREPRARGHDQTNVVPEVLAEFWCKAGSGAIHNVQITVLYELENGAPVLLKLTVILDHMFFEVRPPVEAVIAACTRGHPILAMLLPVKHN